MKRALTLVLAVATTAFASGCSDDSSSDDAPGTISCNYQMSGANFMCATGTITSADCTGASGTVVASCPSGSLLQCPQTGGTVYLYNQAFVDTLKAANASDPCSGYTPN